MVRNKDKGSFGKFFESVDIPIILISTTFIFIMAWVSAFFYGTNNPDVIGGTYPIWDFVNFWVSFAWANWIAYVLIWAGIGALLGLLVVVLMNYFR
jgi:hypothetical protein